MHAIGQLEALDEGAGVALHLALLLRPHGAEAREQRFAMKGLADTDIVEDALAREEPQFWNVRAIPALTMSSGFLPIRVRPASDAVPDEAR